MIFIEIEFDPDFAVEEAPIQAALREYAGVVVLETIIQIKAGSMPLARVSVVNCQRLARTHEAQENQNSSKATLARTG